MWQPAASSLAIIFISTRVHWLWIFGERTKQTVTAFKSEPPDCQSLYFLESLMFLPRGGVRKTRSGVIFWGIAKRLTIYSRERNRIKRRRVQESFLTNHKNISAASDTSSMIRSLRIIFSLYDDVTLMKPVNNIHFTPVVREWQQNSFVLLCIDSELIDRTLTSIMRGYFLSS